MQTPFVRLGFRIDLVTEFSNSKHHTDLVELLLLSFPGNRTDNSYMQPPLCEPRERVHANTFSKLQAMDAGVLFVQAGCKARRRYTVNGKRSVCAYLFIPSDAEFTGLRNSGLIKCWGRY